MPKGFQKGDPRAVEAGRKGGRTPKGLKWRRSVDYERGYAAGWKARDRREQKGAAA